MFLPQHERPDSVTGVSRTLVGEILDTQKVHPMRNPEVVLEGQMTSETFRLKDCKVEIYTRGKVVLQKEVS